MSAPTLVESVTSATEAPAESRSRWLRRWMARLSTFVIGQGAIQAINVAAAFLLIRWLTVDDYAKYSLVIGFQGAAGVLIEMGLGGSMVALLAGRTDPKVVGEYMRSVRHYRSWCFLIFLPLLFLAFLATTDRQAWSWPLKATFLVSMSIALYAQCVASSYSVPLIVHQKLGLYYRTPAILGVARLAISFGLYLISALTAASAIWIGSLIAWAQGWLYQRETRSDVAEPANANPKINQEVLSYIRPLIPSTVFYALQGQITILLIAWFGQTQNIAEVGALGRIAQAFLMLGAFNSVVIAPAIARMSNERLPIRYIQTMGGAVGLSVGLIVLSVLMPKPLLWILGKNYAHLEAELVWMMATACVSYLSGVMWTMHSARKWIFSWGVWANIAVVVIVQALGMACMDLSTTKNVIRLSLYSSLANLGVSVAYAMAGFYLFAQSNKKQSGHSR